jgi:uncharacterized protein (TIGR02266 family)
MSILRDDCLPRIHFQEPVSLEVIETGEVLSGYALNLSCGGIFVRTDQLLEEGTRVRLGFAIPGGRPLCTNATVLRAVQTVDVREPAGLALCFEELSASALREIDAYLESFLRPADEQRVRLQLGEAGLAINARPQSCWGNFLSVSADLPFLRVGSTVRLLDATGAPLEDGEIRWVSVQVPPETGVPRLHVGIEVASAQAAAELLEPEIDPVCCHEFVEDSQTLDTKLRAERRPAAQPS